MEFPKFNPKAPHGTISPIENGCVYYQNAQHYDANYNCVEFATGKILDRAAIDGPAPKLKTKPIKLAEQQAKLEQAQKPVAETEGEGVGVGVVGDEVDGAAGAGDIAVGVDEVAAGTSEVSEGIDLVKWAKGESTGHAWFTVKKAMEAAGYPPMAKAVDAKAAISAKHGFALS